MIKMIPAIIAAAGSMVNLSDGSRFLGTPMVDASGSWNFGGAGLSGAAHDFPATHMAGNTSAASPPVFITAVPSITSFSAKPQTRFLIGGDVYEVDTAGKSYSLTNPDPQTLRFEIRPGDKAYYDDADGEACDRAEIERTTNSGDQEFIAPGTPINISYQFMVEPNGPNGSFINTADNWFVTAEMQTTVASGSPAFAIQLDGDHLQVVARYCPVGLNPSNAAGNTTNLTLWTDPNPIQTGQYINIQIQANVSDSSGYLQVWVNGNEVADYHGPLGFGTPTYLLAGLYRNAGPSETVAAYFRNLTLTTGPAPPDVSSRRP